MKKMMLKSRWLGLMAALLIALMTAGDVLAIESSSTVLISHPPLENTAFANNNAWYVSAGIENGDTLALNRDNWAVYASSANNIDQADSDSYEDIFVFKRTGGEKSFDLSPALHNGDLNMPVISANGHFVVFRSTDTLTLPYARAQRTAGRSHVFVYSLCDDTRFSFQLSCAYTRPDFPSSPIAHVSAPDISSAFLNQEANATSGALVASPTTEDPRHPVAAVYSIINSTNEYPAVIFESDATNLVDSGPTSGRHLYLRIPNTSRTVLLDRNPDSNDIADGSASHPVLSSNGRFLVFVSTATNLVTGQSGYTAGTSNVFLMDRQPSGSGPLYGEPSGTSFKIYLLSKNGSTPGTQHSRYPSISSDGKRIAFHSQSVLESKDTNGLMDIYLYRWSSDPGAGTIELFSIGEGDTALDGDSRTPAINLNGTVVAFASTASNLVGEYNDAQNVFTREIDPPNRVWLVSQTTDGRPAQQYNSSALPALSEIGRYVFFSSYANLLENGQPLDSIQLFKRDQGNPPGNPYIKPSYRDFGKSTIVMEKTQKFEVEIFGTLKISNIAVEQDNGSGVYGTSTEYTIQANTGGDADCAVGNGSDPEANFWKVDDPKFPEKCYVNIKYQPTQLGQYRGRLRMLIDYGPNQAAEDRYRDRFIYLYGQGVDLVTYAPTSVNAGGVEWTPNHNNLDIPVQMTINMPMDIGQLTIDNAVFSLTEDNCSNKNYATESTCTLKLRFQPTKTGLETGTLSAPLTYQSQGSPVTNPRTLALSGTGTEREAVNRVPPVWDYGVVLLQQGTATKTFTLTGIGPVSDLSLTLEETGAVTPTHFELLENTCPSSLAKDQSCTFKVKFISTEGTWSGKVKVNTTAYGYPNRVFEIPINGAGFNNSIFSFNPEPWDYHNVAVSSSQARNFTAQALIGVQTGALSAEEYDSVTGQYQSTSTFSLLPVNETCSNKTFAVGGVCGFTVKFTPASGGNKTGRVVVPVTVNGLSFNRYIEISGVGAGGTANMYANPISIDFGNRVFRPTAESVSQQLDLTSIGTVLFGTLGTQQQDPLSGNYGGTSAFIISNDTCSGKILDSNTCTVTITYSPKAIVSLTGQLVVPYTVQSPFAAGVLYVPFYGKGVDNGKNTYLPFIKK